MFGASVLGVALAEGILRLVWTRPAGDRAMHSFDFTKVLQRDHELGYVPRASVTVEYPPYHAVFDTNAAGLRGPEVPVERTPGRRRIVVLGDSFAWGHGVSAGLAFPEVIDAALPDTDVVNLGVPGYDLAKLLAFYRRVGRRYRPDLVIVSICQNDFRMDDVVRAAGDSRSGAVRTRCAVKAGGSQPVSRGFKQWLHRHSYLYLLLQQTINTNKSLSRAAVAIGLKEDLAGFELLDDNLRPALIDGPPCVEQSYARIQQQLLAIRDAVHSDNADILVALIPCIQSIDAKELAKSIAYTKYDAGDFDLSAPMHRLMGFCKANDIAAVDPTAAFKAAFGRGESLYLPGDLHFNAAGHAMFARCILDAMPDAAARPRSATPSRVGNKSELRQSSR